MLRARRWCGGWDWRDWLEAGGLPNIQDPDTRIRQNVSFKLLSAINHALGGRPDGNRDSVQRDALGVRLIPKNQAPRDFRAAWA